jgi:nucleoid DNA-binding protein
MNKKELVSKIAESSGLSTEKANLILQEIIVSVTKSLKKRDSVNLRGFGVFHSVKMKPRTLYNIKTKEPYKVKGKKVVRFRASSVLQEKIV